ncbi:hypothetical protein [Edaphobacter aggregans]|uniref:hypothetical protein n=1 Tax=Edaphobacter aggregans TaxID=570835 RepID=UPI000F739FFD|nr:hypothetical protein [Edaphobacter aggregans]
MQRELERILASTPFKGSRRYPALLRHVVEKTLRGEIEDLKERILGIEVFQRPTGYDTNADPVVRFSAGEIRRRIAQFYQYNSDEASIEIGLPVGSYIPQFFRNETREEKPAALSEKLSTFHHEFDPEVVLSAPPQILQNQVDVAPVSRRKTIAVLAAGIAVGVLAAIVGFVSYPIVVAHRQENSSAMQIWGPLLANPNMVLISAGHTHWTDNQPPEPQDATVEQHILRPEARISLPAVQAISQVAAFLQTQHKQFRIHEAVSTNLQDLHGLPVVLIAGYNNSWTLRLLKPLRFHLTEDGRFRYIEDAENPGNRDWGVDFDKPYRQQTADYAIIGRFFDPTTNGPVAVVAGISSTGTSAAGEFMVSQDALNELAHLAPHGSLAQNFEAVIKVEVVEGSPGAVTILATKFW